MIGSGELLLVAKPLLLEACSFEKLHAFLYILYAGRGVFLRKKQALVAMCKFSVLLPPHQLTATATTPLNT
jgi:hypothetical protein